MSAAFPGYQGPHYEWVQSVDPTTLFSDHIAQIPIFIGQHSLDWLADHADVDSNILLVQSLVSAFIRLTADTCR